MTCGDVEANPGPPRDDYQVRPDLIPSILAALQAPTPLVDLFSQDHNRLFGPSPGGPDAFRASWRQLGPLWANPPFHLLAHVASKLEMEGGFLILICPGWKKHLPFFWRLSSRQYQLPPGPIFRYQGRFDMPPPSWTVWALYIDYCPRTGSPGPPAPALPAWVFSTPSRTNPLPPGLASGSLLPPPFDDPSFLLHLPHPLPPPPPERVSPLTGRGFSLLSTGVEPNPGPMEPPGPSAPSTMERTRLFLAQWGLTGLFTLEDDFPPHPGPCGVLLQRQVWWVSATCTCGNTLDVGPPGLRPLVLHITRCVVLHTRTGRGDALRSCGDIEENPGPLTPPGSEPPPVGHPDVADSMVLDGAPAVPPAPLFFASHLTGFPSPLPLVPPEFALPPLPPLDLSTFFPAALPVIPAWATSSPPQSPTFPCPLGCREPLRSQDGLVSHLERIHLRSGHSLSPDVLAPLGRWVCRSCQRLWAVKYRTCHQCGRNQSGVHESTARFNPPVPRGNVTPFDAPCPLLCPSLEDILVADRPTLRHLPRMAREEVAGTLAYLLDAFTSEPGWETLHRLLAFPKVVLVVLDRGGKSHWATVGRVVRDRARDFLDHSVEELWALGPGPRRPTGQPGTRRQVAREVEVQQRVFLQQLEGLVADGCYSKACKHLTSAGLLDGRDPSVVAQLRALHPSESSWDMTIPPSAPHFSFSDAPEDKRARLLTVLHLVRSFGKGSSAGPSGLRPDHLKEVLEEEGLPSAGDLLGALERFLSWAVRDGLPRAACPFFAAARLTPLNKATAQPTEDLFGNSITPGDPKVRPIASGDVLRRLVAKFALAQPAVKRAVKAMAPLQIGVGVRGAADLVPQGLQAIVSDLHQSDPSGSWAVLKVDLKNAFNCIWRSKVQEALTNRCPELLPWFHSCYGAPSPLVLGDRLLQSASGVQQGDPLGPALFALAIQDVLDHFASCPHLWQSWYLDDVILLGPVEVLNEYLTHLQCLGSSHRALAFP